MPKLMNCEAEYPQEFFLFSNRLSIATQRARRDSKRVSSGAFSSLGDPELAAKYDAGTLKYLPYVRAANDKINNSPYFLAPTNDYRIEHDCELVRAHRYPQYPSRFSAVFTFGDYETCQEVHGKYRRSWPMESVKKCRLIENPRNRVVRVNIEYLTVARQIYKLPGVQVADIARFWDEYWSGNRRISFDFVTNPAHPTHHFEAGCFWNYIIEGEMDILA